MMKVMRCRRSSSSRRRRCCCYCCCSTESSQPQFLPPPPPPPPPPWLNRGASCCIKSRQTRPIDPSHLSAAAIGLDAFFLRFCGHSPSQGRASPSPSPPTNMTSITPSATAQPAVTLLSAGAWFRLPHRRRRVRGAAAGAPHDCTRVRLLKKCNTLLRRSLGSTRL